MPGIKKEHDWFAENLSNPSFTNTDFKSVGINAANTSLGPIDVYLQTPDIQRLLMFQTNGRFDESKVRLYYSTLVRSYNNLAKDTYNQDLDADKSAIFSQYDLFVSPERRNYDVPSVMTFKPNPDHNTFGLIDFNTPGVLTKTPEELSESLPIWDPDTKTWTEDTPEDSLFKYFFRPTVLATWDYDADINGNPTNDPSQVAYHKGLPKVNEFGEYYLEFLNGRSSDGKKLLHKTNILTREDSWINKYDPFDNDGYDKSVWGSIALNAIKIVPLFIPYVGEAYLYTNLGLGAALALTTLGRMFVGSDNAFLNTASSVMESFHTTPSDYAALHAFSMENVLNMVGDTMEFIKGQRLLAEKAPQWFGSKIPKGLEEFNAKVNEMTATKLRGMEGIAGTSEEYLNQLTTTLKLESTAELQQLIKNYLKLGQQISRNYMAITFGTHTYSTAKSLGVSDLAATILTLGAIGGQYALLSSHIGNWVFPEAKLEALEMKLLAKNVIENVESDSFKAALAGMETAASTSEKIKSFKDIFKIGRSLAGKVYNSPMKTAAQAGIASSIASGVEMTSFSVLDDIIAETYNIAQWLGGGDHRMSAFENIGERYLTSFLGGAVAGAMSAKEIYRASKAMHSLSPDLAFEKMVAIVADGKKDKFLKEVDQTSWGNKYLSTEDYAIPEEGQELYKQGTEINNQDKLIKDAIHKLVDLIEKVLKANDVMISPTSLIKDDKTLGLVKTSLLQGSVVAKDFLGNLNKKLARLVKVLQEIAGISDPEERKQEEEIKKADKDENRPKIPINELENLREERRKIIEELHKYKTGEIMQEYLPKAIFDMSPGINFAYINGNFVKYTEAAYNKPFSQLTLVEREEAREKYKKWVNENKLDAVTAAYDLFSKINPVVSDFLGKLKSDGVIKDLNLGETKVLKHFLVEDLRMQKLLSDESFGLIDSTTKLAVGSINFNTKAEAAILRNIIDEINITNKDRANDKLIFEALRDYARNEEFKDEAEDINRYISAFEVALYRDEILDKLSSDLKDRKYLNNNIKYRLYKLVDEGLLYSESIYGTLFDTLDGMPRFEPFLTELFRSYDVNKIMSRELFIERFKETGVIDGNPGKANEVLNTLNDIKDYDLLDTLSSFGKQITKEKFDIKLLFLELSKVFEKNQETIDKFLLGLDKINLIDLALLVINLFKSGIVATNNVVDNMENIIGFNPAINSMIKGSKLTVQNPNDVAMLLQDLNILETKLEYFKLLTLYARANKFNEIANVENGFRTTLYTLVKNKLENLPSGWLGREALQQTISGLSNLDRLSSVKFSSLSPESQIKLIKEYTLFEQALHDFFLENISNLENVDSLKEFLNKFDLITENNATIGLENFSDDLALVWYLASLAALDPKKFYSNFIESSVDNLAPTFSRITLIYLMTSMLSNRGMFDKFIKAYNEVVDEKIRIGNPDFYKFSGRRVKFDSTVLLQSGAGAGKSFAILPQFLNLVRQIDPSLLNNVWIASTCPILKLDDNTAAKNLAVNWKIDTKNVFTKTQLMNMISSEWHESVNGDLQVEVNSSDIEVDEDRGIVKYNFKLRKDHKNLPKLIIIDEIADYSESDTELINRFAKNNGIFVVAAGDLLLVGLVGKKKIKVNNSEDTNIFYLGTNQFVHTFYNTANYRTENSLLDKNILYDRIMLSLISGADELDIPIYEYYVDKLKGLFGRKTIVRDKIDEIKLYIDILVQTNDKEKKIGYVYDNEDSEVYKYIKENYDGEFSYFYRYPVKGEEAQYYVYDLYNETFDSSSDKQLGFNREVLIKTLYTVFTRSKQGTLFIKPLSPYITSTLSSKLVNYVTIAQLDFLQLKKYSDAIIASLKEIYPDVSKIEVNVPKQQPQLTEPSGSSESSENELEEELNEEELKENPKIKLSEEDKKAKVDDSTFEFGEPLEKLSVERKNLAFDLSSEPDLTIIEMEEEPVEKQVISLNKVVQPVVKKFEYMNKNSRVLFDDGTYTKSEIREVFNFGLYTRFNNYTGLVKDVDYGYVESEGVRRLDNYYGLLNLFNLLDVPQISRKQYTLVKNTSKAKENILVKRNVLKFLLNIREMNYRIVSKDELKNEVVDLIKNTFGVDINDPYIRFMWESTAHDLNYLKNHTDFGKFYRSKNEASDDPNLSEKGSTSAKGLSMILGADVNGKDLILLTVPLAKLPYWKTIIKNSEGPSGQFLRNLLPLIELQAANDPEVKAHPEIYEYKVVEKYKNELESILKGNSTNAYTLGVASLYHLLNIYLYNKEGAVYLDTDNSKRDTAAVLNDPFFTLAKYFNSTGPFVFANERLADSLTHKDYDVNTRITTNKAEYVDIEKIVDGGLFTISPILITKEDVKTTNDVVRVLAGRPFILVGDSSLSQTELYDSWIEQLNDVKAPKRVKEVYVLNPKSTLKDYIEQLKAWSRSKVTGKESLEERPLIGNDLTAFRILEHLDNSARDLLGAHLDMWNKTEGTALDYAFGGTPDHRISKISPEIKYFLSIFSGEQDSSTILLALKKKSAYKNMTYGRLFNLALRLIVDPKFYFPMRDDLPYLLDRIDEFIAYEHVHDNLQNIFYNIKFGDSYPEPANGVTIFKIKTDSPKRGLVNSYRIADKPFQVNMIMTPIMTGDLYPLLAKISTDITFRRINGKQTMSATGAFAKNNARPRNVIISKGPAKKDLEIRVNKSAAESLGLITSDDLLSKVNIATTIKNFKDNGYPAFLVNGVTYLLTNKPSEARDNKISSILVINPNEILVEYEGDNNVKLTLLPIYEGTKVKEYSVLLAERTVLQEVTVDESYFDVLQAAILDPSTSGVESPDHVDMLKDFRTYIEDVNTSPYKDLILAEFDNNVDARGRLNVDAKNFSKYLEIEDDYDELDKERLIRKLGENTAYTDVIDTIEKFTCSMIFKL